MAGEEPATLEQTHVGALVGQWKKSNDLVVFGASGCICKIGKSTDINRREVCQNAEVLEPVIVHLGFLDKNWKRFSLFSPLEISI